MTAKGYIWNYEKIISGFLVLKFLPQFTRNYDGDSRGFKIFLSIFTLFMCFIAVCSIGEGVLNILFHILCIVKHVEPDNILMMTWVDWLTPTPKNTRTNLSQQGYLDVRSVMSAIHTYERGSGGDHGKK